MLVTIRRRTNPAPRRELVEIVTPRTNAAVITPTENLLPTFSVSLDPRPVGEPGIRDAFADASAARYGRDASLVDEDLRSALARIAATRTESMNGGSADREGSVGDPAAAPDEQDPSAERPKPRNEHRDPRCKPVESSRSTSPGGGQQSSIEEPSDPVQPRCPWTCQLKNGRRRCHDRMSPVA